MGLVLFERDMLLALRARNIPRVVVVANFPPRIVETCAKDMHLYSSTIHPDR